MRTKRLFLPALALALAGTLQLQDDERRADLEARVKTLEGRLGGVESYLQAQAQSAALVGAAVERAVEEGFTAGINPHSRELLVEAWSAQTESAGQHVPGLRPAPAVEPVDPRITRRKKR